MASTLIQFREDDAEKLEAMEICEQLGLNLQYYLKMCLSRLIKEKGIPFSMRINSDKTDELKYAMKRAQIEAEKNGLADMTLDEINAEILEVRNSK